MRKLHADPDRMAIFSDGVMAIVITIMVLELRPPESASLRSLLPLWPTAISYAVSYFFIAIIWINHHHLLRFVRRANSGLLWLNFAHLFVVSLLPFATAWIADSRLAPVPVAFYATIFVLVNVAYLAFERAVFRQAGVDELPEKARHMARWRTFVTISIFGAAIAAALVAPRIALAMICGALLLYFRPDIPGSEVADSECHGFSSRRERSIR